MEEIKRSIIRILFLIGISLALWFLIALIYVFALKPIFGESIWKAYILGGSGYYACVYANKTSTKITNTLFRKNNKK